MRNRWFAVLALMAALGLFVPSAAADHGQGKGKDHGKGNPHADRDGDHDRGPEHHGNPHAAMHDRDDDRRWAHHDRYDVRVIEVREARPLGWRQGTKTGWGNCGLPPGQAKKYGECRTYVYERRRYYYYHDDVGRIVIRRPSIEIHAVIR